MIVPMRVVSLFCADPPRAGLGGAVIEYLRDCSAHTFVYVSCDPATQARDLHKLCDERQDRPFGLEYVQPVDMFPQTHHIETVALLRR
jgi:23S rRNA (uracil1939-C5)-methyltransferase